MVPMWWWKKKSIGHVQKWLGTGLRNVKKDMKGKKLQDGRPIGGKKRVTDAMIDILQTYYGIAIRDHQGDLQGMAKAVWAGMQHRRSTDEKPRHEYCPKGAESWCGWQRVAAGAQEEYHHHNPIPDAVFQAIKPLYIRLSSKELLQRCLLGATQNCNESFNALVWSLCPKESFCGLKTVEIAVCLSVLHFNNGAIAVSKVLGSMGCSVGVFTARQLQGEDRKRLRSSKRKESEAEKKQRKVRRRRRKGLDEHAADQEGVTYKAGAF